MFRSEASQLLGAYARLLARFSELPDRPAPWESEADLERRCDGVVWLIGWLESHPDASLEEYRAEVARTQQAGPCWPGGPK